MEWFLNLFILHDTLVVSLLVVGITIVIVMLLLFTQKSPENVVKSELGGGENVENALRRVLGEQRWMQAGATSGTTSVDPNELDALQMEVLEKDRTIAELNKQLTQSGSSGEVTAVADDSELLEKLAELEARLQEYEIIEDDIADLSLYKTENEKLKSEIDKLKAQLGGAAPVAEPEPAATPEPEPDLVEALNNDEPEGVDGADLVAEFEKVVNSQSQVSEEGASSKITVKKDNNPGKVMMADELAGKRKVEAKPLPIHPKLQNVSPDSKEEAEVFISELKNLKAITKKTGDES